MMTNQSTELITQNMFTVQTFSSMTENQLHKLTVTIGKRIKTTWLDIKRVDNQTVSVILETTENVDTISTIIANSIQNESLAAFEGS